METGSVIIDPNAVKQFVAMGFERSLILDTYYQLFDEGHQAPKMEVILDRLGRHSSDLSDRSPIKKKSKIGEPQGSPAELPCQFCSKLFSASTLEAHQVSCQHVQR